VFEQEPGASDKEFHDSVIQCDRVYGTHHIGASTDQAQLAVAEETVRIVRAFKDRGQVLNCVN
jgi:D-3-phosphoglycerate dehydrogenase